MYLTIYRNNYLVIIIISVFLFFPLLIEGCDKAQFKCANDICILKAWYCDDKNDCGDYSDEVDCDKLENCLAPNYFLCSKSQKCLPAKFVCDGFTDCHHGEDEDPKYCGGQCNQFQFHCHSNSSGCIPLHKKCDGTADCSDLSDESIQECPSSTHCSSNSFRCDKNSSCIDPKLVCDGKFDCLDKTDESTCSQIECGPLSFRCHDGSGCIPHSQQCDSTAQCRDGSDESHCSNHKCPFHLDYYCGPDNRVMPCISQQSVCDDVMDCNDGRDEINCPPKTCLEDEFLCKDKSLCLSKRLKCNGVPECSDQSDEDSVECNKISPSSCKDGYFQCDRNSCIPQNQVCDGSLDCPNGRDESSLICSTLPTCDSHDTHCSCDNKSAVCRCHTGYRVIRNQTLCEDVNECATQPGICSQKCTNVEGSYQCRCTAGYSHSGTRCVPQGGPINMLIGSGANIQMWFSSGRNMRRLVGDLGFGVHFDFDYHFTDATQNNSHSFRLFWSDSSNSSLISAIIDPTSTGDSHQFRPLTPPDSVQPVGVAFDWLNQLLYWADSGAINNHTAYIGVMNVTNMNRAILIEFQSAKPHNILINHVTSELYVSLSNQNKSSSIEVISMSGDRKRTLITVNDPTLPITFDILSGRIYYASSKLKSIFYIDSVSGERGSLLTQINPPPNFLTVFGDDVYWTSLRADFIFSANKFSGVADSELYVPRPSTVRIFQKQAQPNASPSSSCQGHQCSDICLPATPTDHICVCPKIKYLDSDFKTCLTHSDSSSVPLGVIAGLIMVVLVTISVLLFLIGYKFYHYKRKYRYLLSSNDFANPVYQLTTDLGTPVTNGQDGEPTDSNGKTHANGYNRMTNETPHSNGYTNHISTEIA